MRRSKNSICSRVGWANAIAHVRNPSVETSLDAARRSACATLGATSITAILKCCFVECQQIVAGAWARIELMAAILNRLVRQLRQDFLGDTPIAQTRFDA